MSKNFFDNYKEFVVLPSENKPACKKEFDPRDYDRHFIVTLSLYDSLISCWSEANKYEIEVEKSLEKVLKEFNKKQQGVYHLQILELKEDTSYFVLALSCKIKEEDEKKITSGIMYILEKMISTPLYNEESWYRLIGEKGRVKRQLFHFTYKEYKEKPSF
jgi:hypothetical protein